MTPLVVTKVDALRQQVAEARRQGLSIGLVPTMGALHEGHLSLIRAARADAGFVVVSIFVNPTQFGPHEDFQRYPRPLEQDVAQCGAAGVDLVFAPASEEVYPPSFRTYVEVHELTDVMCGPGRPGHFRGVTTVVLKLFNMVGADFAYFGQKDAQQARVIQQMVRDLDVPVEIRVCPIIREADGLALSSRNQYLEPHQRSHAVVLSQALDEAKQTIEQGERDTRTVQQLLEDRITATPGAVLDYAAVVDAESLRPPDRLGGQVLLALAVRFGATRLIDNILMTVP